MPAFSLGASGFAGENASRTNVRQFTAKPIGLVEPQWASPAETGDRIPANFTWTVLRSAVVRNFNLQSRKASPRVILFELCLNLQKNKWNVKVWMNETA